MGMLVRQMSPACKSSLSIRYHLYLLLAILAVIAGGCGGEAASDEPERVQLAGVISYDQQSLFATVGVVFRSDKPQITGGVAGQTLEYELASVSAPVDITVEQNTGVIVVSNTVSAGSYNLVIVAVGTGSYSGALSTKVTITVVEENSPFTFFYESDPVVYIGNPSIQSFPPIVALIDSNPISYEVTAVATGGENGSGVLPPGVAISAQTGELTVDGTRLTNVGEYTITVVATATMDMSETISQETSVGLRVARPLGTLSYKSILAPMGEAIMASPIWFNAWDQADTFPRSATYSMDYSLPGLTIDANTGVISVDSTEPMDRSVTVTAVGTGEFEGRATYTVSVKVVEANEIVGPASYGDIVAEYGSTTEISVTGGSFTSSKDGSSLQAVYSIEPPLSGIEINPSTGVITISDTVLPMGSTLLNVGIRAEGHLSRIVTADITVERKQVPELLTSISLSPSISTPVTTALDGIEVLGSQQFLVGSDTLESAVEFSIARYNSGSEGETTTISAVSIDSLGKISVGEDARIADSGTYRIVAVGKGNYNGTASMNLLVTLEPAEISGILTYGGTLTPYYGIDMAYPLAIEVAPQFGSITYSVEPSLPSGVSINSGSGRITFDSEVPPFVGDYTVTATAPEHHDKSATISIAGRKKTIDSTLVRDSEAEELRTVAGTVLENKIVIDLAQDFLVGNDSLYDAVTLSIARYDDGIPGPTTTVPAVTIDQLGRVSIGINAVVRDTGTYKITATAEGYYEGTATVNVPVVIDGISISDFTFDPIDIPLENDYYLEDGYTHEPISIEQLIAPIDTTSLEEAYSFSLYKLDGDGEVVYMPTGVGLMTLPGNKHRVQFQKDLLPSAAGRYRLEITGVGKYAGTKTVEFKVTAVWNPTNTYRTYSSVFNDIDEGQLGDEYGWSIRGTSGLSPTQLDYYSALKYAGYITLSGVRVQGRSVPNEKPGSVRIGYRLNYYGPPTDFVEVNSSTVLPTPNAGHGTDPKSNYHEVRWTPIQNVVEVRLYPTEDYTMFPTIRFGLIVE